MVIMKTVIFKNTKNDVMWSVAVANKEEEIKVKSAMSRFGGAISVTDEAAAVSAEEFLRQYEEYVERTLDKKK